MKKDNFHFSEIVEQTLSIPELSRNNDWKKQINWKDQLCAILNLIPYAVGFIAGEVKAITESVQNYKATEFFRKFVTFIYNLEDFSYEQRKEFIDEVKNKAQDDFGNVLMSMIDRLDNINKQQILANLVGAKVNGKITIEDFFRLQSVLERIPYLDLDKLHQYQKEYYDTEGDTELLFATGVLRAARYHEDGDLYVLSPLGVNMLKWGMKMDVETPLIKGAATGPSWEDVADVPNFNEMKEVINKTINERQYEEAGKDMFDYDVARGK